jgi:hypothetical protein
MRIFVAALIPLVSHNALLSNLFLLNYTEQ